MIFQYSVGYGREVYRNRGLEPMRLLRDSMKWEAITKATRSGHTEIKKITWSGHFIEKSQIRIMTVEVEAEKPNEGIESDDSNSEPELTEGVSSGFG